MLIDTVEVTDSSSTRPTGVQKSIIGRGAGPCEAMHSEMGRPERLRWSNHRHGTMVPLHEQVYAVATLNTRHFQTIPRLRLLTF